MNPPLNWQDKLPDELPQGWGERAAALCQDHDEAQRGDAERPGDADLGDPQVGLVHLVRGRGGPVEHGGGDVHAERELDESDHQGENAPGGAPQGRDEAEEGRARSRNGHEDGQPREVSSNHCTFHCRVPLTA